jgi:hypothetical protein
MLRRVTGGRIAVLAVVALAFLPGSARAATNTISTVAGNGTAGFAGDGGPVSASQLNTPLSVSPTPDGGYLIADQGNNRVRRVAPDDTITTVAGNGTAGSTGDGGPATEAELAAPSDAEMLPDGSILIADSNNNEVRRVAPNGTITTVVGNAALGAGFSGDGSPATAAKLAFPTDIAVASDGTYYISDNDNNRVRVVSPNGIINTYAGGGGAGLGDGGPANQAQLNGPSSVSLIPGGGLLIAELDGNRIRRVASNGTISTVAGDGVAGYNGDNIAATSAELNKPGRVVAASDGSFLIADSFNNRIRRVSPAGVISTVAGDGTAGSAGDGGPATAAELNEPLGLAINAGNDYLIADSLNHRVRVVDAGNPPPPVVASVQPPSVRSSTSAVFSGSVNPEGSATSVHFVYGLDARYRGPGASGVVYDQSTSTVAVGSDSAAHNVSLPASGLVPNARYHVQLVATNAAGTTRGPDQTFTTAKDKEPAPPVLAEKVNVLPVAGLVRIKVNGRFVPLTEARQIKPGSQIDARQGTLKLVTAIPKAHGKTQEATLSGAVFKSAQARAVAQKGLTTLILIEGAFPGAPSYASCRAGKAGDSAHAALSSRALQTLRASDNHGRFRTRGRYSAGTVRGTQWNTSDRCDGTLTTVRRGSVSVLDFARNKTVIVRASHHYLAKPKSKAKKHK